MTRTRCILIVIGMLLWSCAAFQGKDTDLQQEPETAPHHTVSLSQEEQAKKALEIFNRILDVSQSEDRSKAVNTMVEMYMQIISDYPDAPLAQESYWRIIELYLRDFDPPRVKDSVDLYKVFISKYENSPIHNAIESTIEQYFYKNQMWKDLLSFVSPRVEHFVNTGEIKSPTFMFLHAEAKMNLGDKEEARKAYRIVVRYFPESRDAKIATKRLHEMAGTDKMIEEKKK